jgi:hypothetical protein
MAATTRRHGFAIHPLLRPLGPLPTCRRRHGAGLPDRRPVARNRLFPAPPLAPRKKFDQNGHNRRVGRVVSCGNPRFSVDGPPKSLILQKTQSTGWCLFSTESTYNSPLLVVSSTNRFSPTFAEVICISFFYKEKNRENGADFAGRHPRKTTIAYFLIHGFSAVLRQFRGYPWMQLSFLFSRLSAQLAPIPGFAAKNPTTPPRK